MKMYQTHLNAIEQSQSIPLFAFKDWCTKQLSISEELFSRIFKIDNAKTSNHSHFLVSIKDQSLFNEYFSRFKFSSTDNKVGATLHGNSKKGKIDGGVLNFKHHFFDKHGVSVCFSDCSTDFEPSSKHLLLIENLNNFLNPNDVLVGISEKYLDSNVVWSKGTEISSKQYTVFLNKYESITCFLDFDLGGFGVFKSLKGSLASKSSLRFYHPENLTSYLTLFGKQMTDKQLLSLRKYQSIPELSDIVQELLSLKIDGRRSYRFLEQEALQISLENKI